MAAGNVDKVEDQASEFRRSLIGAGAVDGYGRVYGMRVGFGYGG